MNPFAQIARDWATEMSGADRVRIVLAGGFVFGALSHFGWVIAHGHFWYRGPAPEWAPVFWYALCAVDFLEAWLLLAAPRAGIAFACVVMAVSLWVNWTQFPTFEHQFNWILIGLTLFGVLVWATAPWLWKASRWKLSPQSSAHSGD